MFLPHAKSLGVDYHTGTTTKLTLTMTDCPVNVTFNDVVTCNAPKLIANKVRFRTFLWRKSIPYGDVGVNFTDNFVLYS